jgi:hypothetical protein
LFREVLHAIISGIKSIDKTDMEKPPPPPPTPPDFADMAGRLRTYNEELLTELAKQGGVGEWQEEVREILAELPDVLEGLPSWFG